MYQLNLITFLWVSGWAIHAGLDLASGKRRSISAVVLVFYFFYGLPLLWDMVFGQPQYFQFPGFREPAWSTKVGVVYDLFVMSCPVFWWITAPSGQGRLAGLPDFTKLQRIRSLLWVLAVSPLIALVFAPDPGFYASYGAVVSPSFGGAVAKYHVVIGATCLFSTFAGFAIVISERRIVPAFVRVFPFVALACWLSGKRIGVFLAAVLIWIAFWVRRKLRFNHLILGGFATLALLAGYSNYYQAALRPTALAPGLQYENARIDYGRDHDLRTALYCEFTHDRQILSYRGESVVFYLTMMIPRVVWPEKPLDYATYMAAAALNTRAKFFGWTVTTSVLDEAIANFSWAGLLIGPLLLAMVCRIADRADPLGKAVGATIACIFLTLEITPLVPLILCWLVYLAWSRWSARRGAERSAIPYLPAQRAVQGQ